MFPCVVISIRWNNRVVVILSRSIRNTWVVLQGVHGVDSWVTLARHRKCSRRESVVEGFLIAILFLAFALVADSFVIIVHSCLQSIVSCLNGWKIPSLVTLFWPFLRWLLHLVVLLEQLYFGYLRHVPTTHRNHVLQYYVMIDWVAAAILVFL